MTTTPDLTPEQQAQKVCHDFNTQYPPGTPVLAWPGSRDEEPLRTRTRYSAWPIGEHSPAVSVLDYPGGIALTHIEHDPTRQPAVPDVEFQMPPCPLCGRDLDSDGDTLVCRHCAASWAGNGTRGEWHDPTAERCRAVRHWHNAELPNEQCALALGHSGEDHRPADGIGDWKDTDSWAVVDCDGNQLKDDR